jgi:hypothetical protein
MYEAQHRTLTLDVGGRDKAFLCEARERDTALGNERLRMKGPVTNA